MPVTGQISGATFPDVFLTPCVAPEEARAAVERAVRTATVMIDVFIVFPFEAIASCMSARCSQWYTRYLASKSNVAFCGCPPPGGVTFTVTRHGSNMLKTTVPRYWPLPTSLIGGCVVPMSIEVIATRPANFMLLMGCPALSASLTSRAVCGVGRCSQVAVTVDAQDEHAAFGLKYWQNSDVFPYRRWGFLPVECHAVIIPVRPTEALLAAKYQRGGNVSDALVAKGVTVVMEGHLFYLTRAEDAARWH